MYDCVLQEAGGTICSPPRGLVDRMARASYRIVCQPARNSRSSPAPFKHPASNPLGPNAFDPVRSRPPRNLRLQAPARCARVSKVWVTLRDARMQELPKRGAHIGLGCWWGKGLPSLGSLAVLRDGTATVELRHGPHALLSQQWVNFDNERKLDRATTRE